MFTDPTSFGRFLGLYEKVNCFGFGIDVCSCAWASLHAIDLDKAVAKS